MRPHFRLHFWKPTYVCGRAWVTKGICLPWGECLWVTALQMEAGPSGWARALGAEGSLPGRSPHCCLVCCSGAEDRHGYIWDRHYNICLAKLQHDNVVNSVAFSPVEQELLLTASDDATIKVWRSPRTVRIQQARKPRPRKLLFSWLMNQKS